MHAGLLRTSGGALARGLAPYLRAAERDSLSSIFLSRIAPHGEDFYCPAPWTVFR